MTFVSHKMLDMKVFCFFAIYSLHLSSVALSSHAKQIKQLHEFTRHS